MKRILFLLLVVAAMTTFSCTDRYEDVEIHKSVIPHTLAEDLRIVNKFVTIDTVNYSFYASITDSIIQAEGISKDNLVPIFENLDELNKKIKKAFVKERLLPCCFLQKRSLNPILSVIVMSFLLRMRKHQTIVSLLPAVILHCRFTEEIGAFLMSLSKRQTRLRAYSRLITVAATGRHHLLAIQVLLLMATHLRCIAQALLMEMSIAIGGLLTGDNHRIPGISLLMGQ